MTTKIRVLLCALAAASIQLCSAQLSLFGLGSLSFDTNAPVYDLTGQYQFNQQVPFPGSTNTVGFGVFMNHDAHGRLFGSGTTILQIGDSFVAPNYTLSGRVTGGGGSVVRAVFSVHMSGADVIAGVLTVYHVSARFDLEVRPEGLDGEPGLHLVDNGSRATLSMERLGNISFFLEDISVPLPQAVDGSWTVQTDIVPVGSNQLRGSASIVFPNGRTLPTRLSGNYSSSSALAKMRLSGVNVGSGTSLTITASPGDTSADSASGRLLGQTVQLTPPVP